MHAWSVVGVRWVCAYKNQMCEASAVSVEVEVMESQQGAIRSWYEPLYCLCAEA